MKTFFGGLVAISVLLSVAGCDPGPQKLSDEDRKAIKGGPMPPGTWEKMAKWREKTMTGTGTAGQAGLPSGSKP